ncbi:hypothetical protein ABZS93_31275 [Streptomyces sp900116325]|uniref:hypothetical protein n=1 Tax=Streptomyces sp. 900116325 TaxID=3154295 RepID=UPI0033BE8B01
MAGDTADADALVVQGVGLGVKEWRRERDVLQAVWAWEESHILADERERIQAAEHALCFGSAPVMAAATGDIDP